MWGCFTAQLYLLGFFLVKLRLPRRERIAWLQTVTEGACVCVLLPGNDPCRLSTHCW